MWGYIVGGIVAVSVLPGAAQVAWAFIRPKVVGVAGERQVDRSLRGFVKHNFKRGDQSLRKFEKSYFARFKDVLLKSGDKTSQIDNLYITPYGLFVIETKNYAGNIWGEANAPKWEQYFLGRKEPRKFYNPIWQNNGHIKALRELLKDSYPNLPYYNIVVFSKDCNPPVIPGVVRINELEDEIAERFTGVPFLEAKDVAAIKRIIEKNNIKDPAVRREHIANAKKVAARANEREKSDVVRKKAKGNEDGAYRVQMAYSKGPMISDPFGVDVAQPALDKKIKDAEILGRAAAPRNDGVLHKNERFNQDKER